MTTAHEAGKALLHSPAEMVGVALLAGVLVMAFAARVKQPAIVFLLATGALLGPSGLGVMDARSLGAGLPVLTEVAIALILFEGTLSLRPKEWSRSPGPIRNLLTIGALITFAGATAAAHLALGMEIRHAAVAGAILVVTGPTVVTPLLAHVRPLRRLADILRWEGILIDPIGALTAVVVLGLAMPGASVTVTDALQQFAVTAIGGTVVGVVLGLALDRLLRVEGLIEERLRGPLGIAVALGSAALAEPLGANAGLFSATAAGLVLMFRVTPGHEDMERVMARLTDVLLALLFVLLSQLVEPGALAALALKAPLFLGALVLVRLVSVFASTVGAGLSFGERLFLAWVAPRGVVAASVASLFAARLAAAGDERAGDVSAAIFLVIVATVLVQGVTARPVGRLLGVLAPDPLEVLIVGAGRFGRALASELARAGVPTTLVDRNPMKLVGLDLERIRAIAADAHDPDETSQVDRGALALVVAATPNDEANALACTAFERGLPKGAVTQVPSGADALTKSAAHVATRFPFAFGERLTLDVMEAAIAAGARLRTVPVEGATRSSDLRASLKSDLRPLIEVRQGAAPRLVVARNDTLGPKSIVIGIEGVTKDFDASEGDVSISLMAT